MDEHRSEKISSISEWQPKDEHYLQSIENSYVQLDESIPVSNIIYPCVLKIDQL